MYLQALLIDNRSDQGWLHDVLWDLQWMADLVSIPFELPALGNRGWEEFLRHLAFFPDWQKLVKHALYLHTQQEKVAHDTIHCHELVLQELRAQGRIEPCDDVPPETEVEGLSVVCDLCPASFHDKRALANHRFRVHQHHSAYIQSTTCGAQLSYHTSGVDAC